MRRSRQKSRINRLRIRCRLAELVDIKRLALLVFRGDQRWIKLLVTHIHIGLPFVRRCFLRGIARFDVIDRRNCRITQRIVNRNRGRLVERIRIIAVEDIRVAFRITRILRNNLRICREVQTQFDFLRSTRQARIHWQLEIFRTVRTRRGHRSVIVDRENLQVLALAVHHIPVIIHAERTISRINGLARCQARLHGEKALAGDRKIECVQRGLDIALRKLLLDGFENGT